MNRDCNQTTASSPRPSPPVEEREKTTAVHGLLTARSPHRMVRESVIARRQLYNRPASNPQLNPSPFARQPRKASDSDVHRAPAGVECQSA